MGTFSSPIFRVAMLSDAFENIRLAEYHEIKTTTENMYNLKTKNLNIVDKSGNVSGSSLAIFSQGKIMQSKVSSSISAVAFALVISPTITL